MAKDKVRAGQFDRQITIQKHTRVDDGAGGDSGSWATVYTCMADIQNQPHGRGLYRRYAFMQLYPEMTLVIQIWFQLDVPIDATMRVQYTIHNVTHTYQIIGVENPAEANYSMFLLCKEYQAKTVN